MPGKVLHDLLNRATSHTRDSLKKEVKNRTTSPTSKVLNDLLNRTTSPTRDSLKQEVKNRAASPTRQSIK